MSMPSHTPSRSERSGFRQQWRRRVAIGARGLARIFLSRSILVCDLALMVFLLSSRSTIYDDSGQFLHIEDDDGDANMVYMWRVKVWDLEVYYACIATEFNDFVGDVHNSSKAHIPPNPFFCLFKRIVFLLFCWKPRISWHQHQTHRIVQHNCDTLNIFGFPLPRGEQEHTAPHGAHLGQIRSSAR
jgi:hypothetical protein